MYECTTQGSFEFCPRNSRNVIFHVEKDRSYKLRKWNLVGAEHACDCSNYWSLANPDSQFVLEVTIVHTSLGVLSSTPMQIYSSWKSSVEDAISGMLGLRTWARHRYMGVQVEEGEAWIGYETTTKQGWIVLTTRWIGNQLCLLNYSMRFSNYNQCVILRINVIHLVKINNLQWVYIKHPRSPLFIVIHSSSWCYCELFERDRLPQNPRGWCVRRENYKKLCCKMERKP